MARERSRSRSSYSYYSSSSEPRPSQLANKKDAKGGPAVEKGAEAASGSKTNGEKPPKVKDASARTGAKTANGVEQEETKAKAALDNLQEMLAERQRDLAKADPERRKDIEKDIEILKQWQAEGPPKVSAETTSVTVASSDAGKAKEKELKKTSKGHTESNIKTSKTEAKVAKEPKGEKKGKTSAEKASRKEAKETKSVSKAEKASKKASANEAKNKDKQRERSVQEIPPKKADKVATSDQVATSDSARRMKDDEGSIGNPKEVPAEQVETKQAQKEDHSKDKLLKSAEMIEQAKEALRHLKQKVTEAEAAPDGLTEEVEDAGEQFEQAPLEDKVTVLMPSEKVPPCELPLWCVMPNPRDVETVFDIVRIVSGSAAPPKRLQLGRRSWALLGRRLHEAQAAEARRAGVPEPDIGLACPISSKAHALVMQNWTGKVFLQDLGSAHGTFVGGVRLKPNEPCEWRPGVQACFANPQLEFFELRVAEK